MSLVCLLLGGSEQESQALSDAIVAAGHRVSAERAPLLAGADVALLLDPDAPLPAREQGPAGCMLVAVARDGSAGELARILRNGADDYLVWPADASQLGAFLLVLRRRRENRVRWIEEKARAEIERRQRAEARLSETEAILRAFLNGAPQRMGVVEVLGDDLRFLLLNDAAAAPYSPSAQALIGRTASEVGVDPRGVRALVESARTARGPVHLEVLSSEREETRSFAVTIVPLGKGQLGPRISFIADDITARKQAEVDLRESAELHRSLFAAVPDSICLIEPGSWALAEVNPAFCQQYGYTEEETRRLSISDLSTDPAASIRTLTAALEHGAATAHRLHRRKDGSRFLVEGHTVRVHLRGKERLCAVLRDVSERAQLEQQLQLADRMATVGTLAAGAAHEINNPLATVLANLSFVTEELARLDGALRGRDRAEIEQALAEARDGAERVRDIVRDLKMFSRPEAGVSGPTDVRRAVEVALRLAANEIRHRARLVTRLDEVPGVDGDASRLAQVFVNLLTNAAQALPDRPADENLIEVRVEREREMVQVVVRDNGRGMGGEEQQRLFEPFYTTRQVGQGAGLGLSVCHGIVSSIGGRIEVASTLGAGSTFRVLLPAAKQA